MTSQNERHFFPRKELGKGGVGGQEELNLRRKKPGWRKPSEVWGQSGKVVSTGNSLPGEGKNG